MNADELIDPAGREHTDRLNDVEYLRRWALGADAQAVAHGSSPEQIRYLLLDWQRLIRMLWAMVEEQETTAQKLGERK